MRAVVAMVLGICGVAALAGVARARPNPTPPPSGIVVHLFGDNSIMSNILPTAAPRPAGRPPAPGAPPAPAGDAAATTSNGYVEPSMGDVMHQMFVTGDPDAPPQRSTGRTGKGLSGG